MKDQTGNPEVRGADRELGHKPRCEIKLSREQVTDQKGHSLRERENPQDLGD